MKIKKTMPIICTEKLDAVRDFYTRHFDFKVTFDYPGQFLGLRSQQNAELELAFAGPSDCGGPYEGQGATLCFEVDDVDAEHARLSTAGLTIGPPLQNNPWGDRSFGTVDPAGVAVYVYTPIEVATEFKQYFKE